VWFHAMEGADLEEAMQHWYEREEAIFHVNDPASAEVGMHIEATRNGEEESSCPTTRPSTARRACVLILRHLLQEYGALSELPTVLTLFDSIKATAKAKTRSTKRGLIFDAGESSSGAEAFSATLAAVVRVTAKTKLTGYYQGLTQRSENAASARFEIMGMATLKRDDVDLKEVCILAEFSHCIGLPTPVDWARATLVLLDSQGGADQMLRQVLFRVMPCVDDWAQFLSVELGAGCGMPPSWLALAACVLGLVATRVMRPSAMWPEGMPPVLWEGSVLGKMQRALDAQPQAALPPLEISASQLSKAIGIKVALAASRTFIVLSHLSGLEAIPPWSVGVPSMGSGKQP